MNGVRHLTHQLYNNVLTQPFSSSTKRKIRIISTNRKVDQTYEIIKSLECGLSLNSSEIKSIQDGHCNIAAAYAEEINNELYLCQSYIPVWRNGYLGNHATDRRRKILAHRSELRKIFAFMNETNSAMIPQSLYINEKGWAKIQLTFAKHKKKIDNREKIDQRDWKRIERDAY